ncbi:competence type IV pilus minor pilin ComGG [Alkalihalobacillus sp. MEB130]|uniref:competence type IV pilus minor pilin ComGG n=1 Tax=Alkalihalobacillus sp. MEB130 TaxID=2976704 RepID=UPI0028DE0343|nr:competence type IV pilus minor pilin ComGG [Alkalihalobacillus sp. MEB130]MDT8863032.1 competence type IV pilus minor pilin ComGG [Alkalihalobacillus sp. MEB130]
MRQEGGFVYPVTVVICMIIMQIVIYQVNMYVNEKHFVHEQERLLQVESLLQVGISEFLRGEYEPTVNKNIIFSYDVGTVTVAIDDFHEGYSQIHVTVKLVTGQERQAGFRYHWSSKTVEHYWEVTKRGTTLLNQSHIVKIPVRSCSSSKWNQT